MISNNNRRKLYKLKQIYLIKEIEIIINLFQKLVFPSNLGKILL